MSTLESPKCRTLQRLLGIAIAASDARVKATVVRTREARAILTAGTNRDNERRVHNGTVFDEFAAEV